MTSRCVGICILRQISDANEFRMQEWEAVDPDRMTKFSSISALDVFVMLNLVSLSLHLITSRMLSHS